MKSSMLIVLTVVAFGLTACGRDRVADTTDTGATAAPAPASTNNQNTGGGITVSPLEAERTRLLGLRTVYFDYDQADIKPEFNALLQAHGQQLAQNSAMTLRLEGHADERGSREYNIGLGERRAQAVRRVLMLQGAQASQLTTVSYGEERPAATGSDEESWRLNRRVELVYR